MNIDGFEIERKFLIAMPEASFLAGCEASKITQTYLLGEENTSERVRQRVWKENCEYTHTVKLKLSNIRRIETENVIDRAEYERLLDRADPQRTPIVKTRYCGKLWELDVFSFWDDRAFLEIELADEEEEFALPAEIRLIREVTDDPRYTNAALSLAIPEETIESD